MSAVRPHIPPLQLGALGSKPREACVEPQELHSGRSRQTGLLGYKRDLAGRDRAWHGGSSMLTGRRVLRRSIAGGQGPAFQAPVAKDFSSAFATSFSPLL